MNGPMLGGLPLSRMSYALAVGAAAVVWSTLYIVALWQGIRATFSRSRVTVASTSAATRSRTNGRADARLTARQSLEDRTGAWEDDGGRTVDEPAARPPRESLVLHAAFR